MCFHKSVFQLAAMWFSMRPVVFNGIFHFIVSQMQSSQVFCLKDKKKHYYYIITLLLFRSLKIPHNGFLTSSTIFSLHLIDTIWVRLFIRFSLIRFCLSQSFKQQKRKTFLGWKQKHQHHIFRFIPIYVALVIFDHYWHAGNIKSHLWQRMRYQIELCIPCQYKWDMNN